MIKTRTYREALDQALANPDEAKEYLNAAMDDSPEAFLKALQNVARVRSMGEIAKETGLKRESLYRSLSEQGNPTLQTLSSVLKVMGLKIAIERN